MSLWGLTVIRNSCSLGTWRARSSHFDLMSKNVLCCPLQGSLTKGGHGLPQCCTHIVPSPCLHAHHFNTFWETQHRQCNGMGRGWWFKFSVLSTGSSQPGKGQDLESGIRHEWANQCDFHLIKRSLRTSSVCLCLSHGMYLWQTTSACLQELGRNFRSWETNRSKCTLLFHPCLWWAVLLSCQQCERRLDSRKTPRGWKRWKPKPSTSFSIAKVL